MTETNDKNITTNESVTTETTEMSVATPAAAKMEMGATGVGSTQVLSELDAKLAQYGATPEVIQVVRTLGVETLDDLTYIKAEELQSAGMKLIQARKLLDELTAKKPAEQPAQQPAMTPQQAPTTVVSMESILPSLPSDDNWLSVLKTGGVLKVDQATYVAAVRAALAERTQIYKVPQKLSEALEQYALETDEPVSPEFYKLFKQLTRRNYADLFAAIDSVDGNFVSEKRKKVLIERINTHLWPAIAESFRQLDAWSKAWGGGFNLGLTIANHLGGGNMMLPPGVNQVPDVSPLRDAGDDIRNALNKALAGTGSVVASAMAYDYQQIKAILQDSSLPAKVGAANREQMYKKLGLSISTSMIRSEANIVRYIMSFVNADNITADAEVGYYSALYTLGAQIGWKTLGITTDVDDSGLTTLGGDAL